MRWCGSFLRCAREFPSLRGGEIDEAVRRAHRASQPWRERAVVERAGVVGRAAVLMRERYEQLTRTITLEMGKLIAHSRAELDLTRRSGSAPRTWCSATRSCS